MSNLAVDYDIQPEDTVIELIPYQDQFIFTKAPYPAAVTAWGTGKTMAGIIKSMDLSEQHPGNLGIVFRKEYTDLRDSTILDFQNYTGLKVNSNRNVDLSNGSTIMFRHLEEMNNIQNVNLGWFWIEQAEELATDDPYFKLFGRLRRKGMPHTGFITANTKGHNWIWRLWKRGEFADTIKKLIDQSPNLFSHLNKTDLKNLAPLFEAQTFVNKSLAPAYLAGLEIIKQQKPKVYNRFVLNSWDEADTINTIIDPAAITRAIGRDLNTNPPILRVVSIDVARYGDDKTIFKAIENYSEVATEQHEKKSTMEVVGLAQIFARKAFGKDNGCAFAVDEIGVGGGVADRLQELEHQVIFVNAAERTDVRKDCYNRRAEIYLNGAELLEANRVSILASDRELIEQLSWAKYKTIKSNGIYQVQPKEEIKADFGRSPDDADAFLNGLWAMPQVKPVKREDKYALKFKRAYAGSSSGMTV
jgi:phage terminase large subunit